MISLFLITLLPHFAQADGFRSVYGCQSVPNAYPTLTIEIREEYSDQGKLLGAEAELVEGDYVDLLKELVVSREGISGKPDLYKTFWTNDRLIFTGIFSKSAPTRNFVAQFTHPKYEDPVHVTCVIE